MRERMLRGEDYLASDPELVALRAHARALLEALDAVPSAEGAERRRLLNDLLGELGEGAEIEAGFRCDYGAHIAIGARTFVNFDCVFLDVAPIRLGEACQLGPRVQLLTATHPVDPVRRREGWECGRPITLADNVWLGGGGIVNPGVAIGENTVVGAGAVVAKDLPPDVVAAGVPARVIRPLA